VGILVDLAVYSASSWDNDITAELVSKTADGANSSNWAKCRDAAGSTPCEDNSVWSMTTSEEVTVQVAPNPFDPQKETSEIKVVAPFDASLETRIYDLRGRLIKNFNSSFTINWDGTDEDNKPVPAGPYVIVVESEQAGKTKHYRFPIAVARGMR